MSRGIVESALFNGNERQAWQLSVFCAFWCTLLTLIPSFAYAKTSVERHQIWNLNQYLFSWSLSDIITANDDILNSFICVWNSSCWAELCLWIIQMHKQSIPNDWSMMTHYSWNHYCQQNPLNKGDGLLNASF